MKNTQLNKIIEMIAAAISGTEFANNTFVVGGFVRDFLLGNARNDLDFVVNLPEGGIRLATFLHKQKLCSTPIIYKRFGTAMVQMKYNKIEFVMTRNESYQDRSRHPEVGYGSLKEDAFRRDFTINALYYNISDQQIYDLTESGKADLEAKLIRSTANPDIIFQEDPLRILRAIRFAGRLNFTVEEKTLQGIIKWRDYLQHISIERVKDEFINMLLGQGFPQSLQLCFETGIMKYILPPLIAKETEVLKLMETINQYPAEVTIRLALISVAVEDKEAMEKAIINLTVNKKIAKQSLQIAKNVQQLQEISQLKKLNKFVFNNLSTLPDALQIMKVNFPDFNQQHLILDKMELFHKYSYPLDGLEIIKRLGLINNQEINYYTKEAKRVWIENPGMGKEEILSLIEIKVKKEDLHTN